VSDPEQRTFDTVDRLVKAHLDRRTEQTDSSALLGRLRQSLGRSERHGRRSAPRQPRSGRRWARPVGWLSVAAAVLIGGFLGGRAFSPSPANAAAILKGVRGVHEQGIDRCYRVHFAPDPRSWDGTNVLGGPSDSVLWTRGDRFWADCSIGPIRLKIGRSEDGVLWVSSSPDRGTRIPAENSHLPDKLSVLCDLNAMTVPALVDDVLADFDLRAEGPVPGDPEASSLVWARLKPGRSHPLIASALLEIDDRSNTLRRLVLWTVNDGQPHGTVTYTLIESATQDDDRYRLEAHLEPGAEIETQRLDRDRDRVQGPRDNPEPAIDEQEGS
jgi:hypothetical protein